MSPVPPSVWLTTLGCAKNVVDSEKIIARLDGAGYLRATSLESADVVMINTCAFIDAAREESVNTILDHATARSDGARLVVLGCMAQRYRAELETSLPEADAVIGIERYGELVPHLDRLTDWSSPGNSSSVMDLLHEVRRPASTTPYAYVKVAEGCDKACTFCAIPGIRGPQRSRSAANILEEVAGLCAAGVGEIVLVAQDLAAYGRDIGSRDGIVGLVRHLSDVPGLRRLRLLYLYPREITPGLVDEVAANPVVAPYFDLSLQHASGDLLRAMGRPGDGERHLRLIDRIRRADSDAALRSSFIVGFPGETPAEVDLVADFLDAARLDWAGFFPYSAEEGTTAEALPGRVDRDEIAERTRHLQSVQDGVSSERAAAQVGRTLDVVVDQLEDGIPVARSYREAPEIDGVILLDRGEPGQWLAATVTASYGLELSGRVVA